MDPEMLEYVQRLAADPSIPRSNLDDQLVKRHLDYQRLKKVVELDRLRKQQRNDVQNQKTDLAGNNDPRENAEARWGGSGGGRKLPTETGREEKGKKERASSALPPASSKRANQKHKGRQTD